MSIRRCKLAGCTRQAIDPTPYCSDEHRLEAYKQSGKNLYAPGRPTPKTCLTPKCRNWRPANSRYCSPCKEAQLRRAQVKQETVEDRINQPVSDAYYCAGCKHARFANGQRECLKGAYRICAPWTGKPREKEARDAG